MTVKSTLSFLSVWVISKTRWDCSTDKTIIIWSRLTAAAQNLSFTGTTSLLWSRIELVTSSERSEIYWKLVEETQVRNKQRHYYDTGKQERIETITFLRWSLDTGHGNICQLLNNHSDSFFPTEISFVWDPNLRFQAFQHFQAFHVSLLFALWSEVKENWQSSAADLDQFTSPTTIIIWRHFLTLLTNTFWR